MPYQVDGEYQHTSRQRKPQNDNTRQERRRKHVSWVQEQVRLETARREENRKYARRKQTADAARRSKEEDGDAGL